MAAGGGIAWLSSSSAEIARARAVLKTLTPGGVIDELGFLVLAAAFSDIAVSMDRAEVLASWRREATNSALVFATLSGVVIAILIVLFRQMDAKARHQRDSNEQLQAAFTREQAARRQAEAASALKDEFLMTVSHELRTPLTAIYGWARMLRQGAVSDAQRSRAHETIERNAETQTRLIEDLLDVSSLAHGRAEVERQPVHLPAVVRPAIETVTPAAQAKSIRIEQEIGSVPGQLLGDPERLQQVAWNLLSNAVKFTPEGGIVRVELLREGTQAVLRVSDSGAGIAPDLLPHVFDRFRQEDAGPRRQHGGLGLGLAIVRGIVELHGGTVSAHSDGHGHGASFTVRLPISSSAADAANDHAAVEAPVVGGKFVAREVT